MPARVLVVEDDAAIRESIVAEFASLGWNVSQAMDGELGLQLAMDEAFDCLVLDLMLPRVNGYEICKSLRLQDKQVPIIMMSALGEEQDVLKGFKVGTTDYIRKPFSIAELVMRVKVHLKEDSEAQISFAQYKLDSQTRVLSCPDGSENKLTPKEQGVLLALIHKSGQALSRRTLLNQVWGNDWAAGERSVDRCIKTLRQKLHYCSLETSPISSVHQVGYSWVGAS